MHWQSWTSSQLVETHGSLPYFHHRVPSGSTCHSSGDWSTQAASAKVGIGRWPAAMPLHMGQKPQPDLGGGLAPEAARRRRPRRQPCVVPPRSTSATTAAAAAAVAAAVAAAAITDCCAARDGSLRPQQPGAQHLLRSGADDQVRACHINLANHTH
jgi:hypothetical protein